MPAPSGHTLRSTVDQDGHWLHLDDLLVWLRLHRDPTCNALAAQLEQYVGAGAELPPGQPRLRIVRNDEIW